MENNISSSSLLACPLFWIDAFKPRNEWSVGPKSGGEIKNSEAGGKGEGGKECCHILERGEMLG